MNCITLGTFDLLHAGHVKLFKRCREIAGDDLVTVGLNTDEFIAKYKGKPPIQTYQERQEMILSLDYVDQVIHNSQEDGTVKEPVLTSRSSVIVVGSDWGKKDYLKQVGLTWDWLEENSIYLMYVPYTYSISTTMLKERIWTQLSSPPHQAGKIS